MGSGQPGQQTPPGHFALHIVTMLLKNFLLEMKVVIHLFTPFYPMLVECGKLLICPGLHSPVSVYFSIISLNLVFITNHMAIIAYDIETCQGFWQLISGYWQKLLFRNIRAAPCGA